MRVTVYSKPGCGVCTALKRYLQDRGVRFREYDVSRDQEALQDMADLAGDIKTIPVVDIDGEAVVGFDRGRLDQLL